MIASLPLACRVAAAVGLVVSVPGCTARTSEAPVIRLNLDEIAADTAKKDSIQPGFASL